MPNALERLYNQKLATVEVDGAPFFRAKTRLTQKYCEGSGGAGLSGTVCSRDAAVKRTGMYSQRVPESPAPLPVCTKLRRQGIATHARQQNPGRHDHSPPGFRPRQIHGYGCAGALHRNAGRNVRVFKHGPDYLDPMVLEVASGNPVYQLHPPWMTGEDECRWRLAEAAQSADLILVEGSMGLFDGSPPSSGDLAKLAGIPALPVIDAKGMAQTFGAVALGLARFDPELPVHQVIVNKIGSAYHASCYGRACRKVSACWAQYPPETMP